MSKDVTELSSDQLFDYYWKFREREEHHKAQMEAAKKGKETILGYLSKLYPHESVKHHAHETGTFMYNTTSYARVSDANQFMAWVQHTGNFDLLKAACAKKALEEHIENVGALPPGIEYGTVIKPTVRIANKKGILDE